MVFDCYNERVKRMTDESQRIRLLEGIYMERIMIKKNLDDIVHERLLEDIFKGKFKPGEIISVEKICEQYTISRTPVVQAIKGLYADGIVDVSATGKYYFPIADDSVVKELMQTRLLFEKASAMLIFENNYPVDVYEFCKYAEACAKYQEQGDVYNASMYDLKLHWTLVNSTRNNYMAELYKRVQNKCLSVHYLNLNGAEVVSPGAVEGHRVMCEALKKWDRELLLSTIANHIHFVENQILDNIAHTNGH